MMTKMTGLLVRVLDDEARVEVGPFEYQVLVPEAVRRVIQMRTGTEITFHVTEYLEGNSGGNRFVPRRIGFLTETELDFFDLFCTVEKIGAKKALKAMARPVKEIADAIARQDARWLSTLPGIGATTAEQIVTTLKRKITPFVMAAAPADAPPPDAVVEKAGGRRKPAAAPAPAAAAFDGQAVDDTYQALMGVGYTPVEARARLDDLLKSGQRFTTVQEALALIFANKG
ncbi:Holliday junction branch migration protein RuvA [Urbifossiella limnaea]|uniref:Holliday junction branch migration complex subunit RuvA n=1 Tax=Urbifossiella limnaea TaxID=2528023 RepID=A0A517Y0Z7_9BACT|nr:Holliday junction branch migration protein RuvA [Urbifossiella limnaea]QDU23388.1 Holliday junction ATP-dependent DNA helicase RuvA [Urbifossiella limnaea]